MYMNGWVYLRQNVEQFYLVPIFTANIIEYLGSSLGFLKDVASASKHSLTNLKT